MNMNVQKDYGDIFLRDLQKELGPGVIDKGKDNQNLGSTALTYIAALNDNWLLQVVERKAQKYRGLNSHRISNSFMNAVYIDSDYDFNALFLVVKEEYLSMDSEKLNFGTDAIFSGEIQKTIHEMNLTSLAGYGFDTTLNILFVICKSIANHNDFTMDELDYIRMINSHKEFIKYYQLYRADAERVRNYDFSREDHISEFALFYFAMIKVIADVYKCEGKGKGFTIHDAGTNNFQLALMLATLAEDELMQLQVNEIIASDLNLFYKEKVEKYLLQHKDAKPMRYVQQDFLDESIELPEADVTILNDVLEHLPDEQASFRVMERFWERTRKLLIIHVPFEKVLSTQWGHYILFNREKLEEWANRLSGHLSLADEYRFSESNRYSDIGFLILKKVS